MLTRPTQPSGLKPGTAAPNALQQGNAALRDGQLAQAIRHGAIGLVSAYPFDLVHPSKPRLPSSLFGLRYQPRWDARMRLAIDDDELAFVGAEQPLALAAWLRADQGAPPLTDLIGRAGTELGMGFVDAFDGLTVANAAFPRRHGGTLVRRARDPHQFQPSAERRGRVRQALGHLPRQRALQPHPGSHSPFWEPVNV